MLCSSDLAVGDGTQHLPLAAGEPVHCAVALIDLQARDICGEPVDNPKLALIEAICISYFTVEFLLRYKG